MSQLREQPEANRLSALQNYHDVNGTFHDRQHELELRGECPRRTWAFSMLNFIEQDTRSSTGHQFQLTDFYQAPEHDPRSCLKHHDVYDCPSDTNSSNSIEEPTSAYPRSKVEHTWSITATRITTRTRANNPFAGPLNAPPATSTTYANAAFLLPQDLWASRHHRRDQPDTLVFSEVIIGHSTHRAAVRTIVATSTTTTATASISTSTPRPIARSPTGCNAGLLQLSRTSPNPPCNVNPSPIDYRSTRREASTPVASTLALADGSVRFFKSSIALNTWRSLGTIAGNETDLGRFVLSESCRVGSLHSGRALQGQMAGNDIAISRKPLGS